jgi:non-heme chloroperoxidase
MEVFDGILAGLMADRSQFYKDLAIQFYGANRPGAKVSQGVLDQFWIWSMQSGLKNSCGSVTSLLTDFTEDLERFDVPTLIMHGEDDQIIPAGISAMRTAGIIKDAKDIIYPGAPHGITATHQDAINSELLRFLES